MYEVQKINEQEIQFPDIVLLLLCFHEVTGSSNVTVSQNIIRNGLQHPQICFMLSSHFLSCSDFPVVFVPGLWFQCEFYHGLSSYLTQSCTTKTSPRSPTANLVFAHGLRDQMMQLTLSSNKTQNWCLGFSAFLLQFSYTPSGWCVLCCDANLPCADLALPVFNYLLIYTISSSFPSLLPHPTGSPLITWYGNGELLSLGQVHKFYVHEQLFKLFPLIKRLSFEVERTSVFFSL